MDAPFISVFAWILAVSSGLMAGVYLAFSVFIMRALASLGTTPGIDAMRAINTHILNSMFMPLFFGSTIVAVLLAAAGIWWWGHPEAVPAVAAGSTYTIGMFAVTAGCNVPLNNRLAQEEGEGSEAEQVWLAYLSGWTRWNTIRSIASVITLVLCIQILT